MTEDRLARGRRFLGHRRLRRYLLVTLAFAVGMVGAAPAFASSGGAGIGGTHKPSRHKPSRHKPSRHKPSGHRTQRKAPRAPTNPLANRGMWIWVLSEIDGGNLRSIAATARRYGIRTLIIKSGDGTGMWSQFNSQLVSTLHADRLHVCAWQYVYGSNPVGEAQIGAAAVSDGADCLMIDAESEYEGKYAQAQAYIKELRKLVGPNFPVALAGFPYIDYHPAFPYSVFLGPGGAQYNAPQMYWKDIGDTVDAVYAHTYEFNRLYGRRIYPLGQVYNSPPIRQIYRFRQLSWAYGAPGVSWWDWQEAAPAAWVALSHSVGSLAQYTIDATVATISKGAQGDLVVWAQEHLISAGYRMVVDGGFGPKTQAGVKRFQSAHGLTPDGVIGPMTWQALLRYRPAAISWASSGRKASIASVTGATALPESARLPAKRDEIPGTSGAGWPGRP